MKHIIHFIIVLMCMGPVLPASAQTPYRTSVANDRVTVANGNLTLSLTLDLGECVVRTQHERTLTPMLLSADGERQAAFPAVVVSGRNRNLKNRRDQVEDAQPVLIRLHGNKEENRLVDYQASLPFEPWMEQARLEVHETVTGCASCGLQEDQLLVNPQAIYAPQIELSAQMECPEEFVTRHEERDAFLIYPVDKTVLHADRYGNRHELQKIDSALTYVQHNPAYEIHRIDITGFASPEGSYSHNVELAEGRADALKQYIVKHYPGLDKELLHVTPGAENWDGLLQALHTMELPYKDEIIRLAASDIEPDSREAQIRAIGGGQPYQLLLRGIYPGLRKNTFTISYISRERTPEEARQLVFTNPGELNVYEFYKVAERFYADDPATYRKVLMTAADTYPTHSIANNNAARAALQEGRLEEAERYLQHTGNEPYTWNNRGCLLWKQGKSHEAALWWKKAAEAGDAQAAHNVAELQKRGF